MRGRFQDNRVGVPKSKEIKLQAGRGFNDPQSSLRKILRKQLSFLWDGQ